MWIGEHTYTKCNIVILNCEGQQLHRAPNNNNWGEQEERYDPFSSSISNSISRDRLLIERRIIWWWPMKVCVIGFSLNLPKLQPGIGLPQSSSSSSITTMLPISKINPKSTYHDQVVIWGSEQKVSQLFAGNLIATSSLLGLDLDRVFRGFATGWLCVLYSVYEWPKDDDEGSIEIPT